MTLSQTILGVLLIIAAYIDYLKHIVPNRLIVVGGLLGVMLMGWGILGWQEGLMGACFGTGALLGIRTLGYVLYRVPGMGMGDVKLAAVVGLFLGGHVLWVLCWAVGCGAVWGIWGWCFGARQRLARRPFAPCIAVGAVLQGLVPLSMTEVGL